MSELRPLAAAGKPIVISEFSYYSLADNRSGSRWSDGYPTPVATQADRAACYRRFVERMARRPGAGISPRDRASIVSFLVFHQQAAAGKSTAPAGA